MLLPPGLLSATEDARGEPPGVASSVPGRLLPRDVALDGNGVLRGVVMDRQGRPCRRVPIAVWSARGEPARAETGDAGGFRVAGLRGGLYRVTTAGARRLVRLWAPGTAPPAADRTLRLVAGGRVLRGQGKQEIRISSDALLLGAVVLAGAAVPVVVRSGRSDSPPGS